MIMRFLALLLGLLLAWSAAAEARVKAGPGVNPGWHKLGVAANSMLDLFTAPTGAYSFRKLRSSYSGSAVRLRRASDNAEADIGFLGFVPGLGAPWNEVAANAHCAATSCFIHTWYDQSGGVRDVVQATTPANQPALVFNCGGSLPCLETSAATMALNYGVSLAPATGVASMSGVAVRTAGTANCIMLRQNASTGNRLLMPAANTWGAYGSTGGVTRAAADGVWHTGIGVWNGASSSLTIDGATSTGSLTNATAAGVLGLSGGAATTCREGELILWDNYILSAAEIAVLNANQRSYWGF